MPQFEYLVKDKDCFDQLLILKEIRHKVSKNEENEGLYEQIKKKFESGARALLGFKHLGLPKFYAYFMEGNYSYLVQDYVSGTTLAEEVKVSGPLNSETCFSLLLELADILEYLHSQGADIDQVDDDGDAPLHQAAKHGHLDIIEYLLGQGANIDQVNGDGDTPLHCAVYSENLDIVDYLLGQGANIDQVNRDGDTPLQLAIDFGHVDIVKLLLKNGAAICGDLILRGAIEEDRLNVIRFLIEEGIADPSVCNDLALHIAADHCQIRVLKYLICYKESLEFPKDGTDDHDHDDHSASDRSDNELDPDISPDPATIAINNVVFLWGAKYGYIEIIEHFIDCLDHDDPCDYDINGALFLAVESGHLNIIRYLIDLFSSKCDINGALLLAKILDNPQVVVCIKHSKMLATQ